MQPAPFHAKDLSINAQTFLYACAFWTVASDEGLNAEEQEWLIDQFGEAGATQSLEDFVELESDDFFTAFDTGAAGLTDEEKEIILPNLEEWLLSCAQADGSEGSDERQTIEKIKARLSLDDKLRPVEEAGEEAEPMDVVSVEETADATESAGPADVEERLFVGHDGDVTSVCVSGDGQRVVSGSEDGTVRLWQFQDGAVEAVLEGHSLGVTSVCLMPDGSRALSSDRRGCVVCHDLSSGGQAWIQDPGRRGGVTCVDVSADGKQIALSSDVGLLSTLDAFGKELSTFGDRKKGAIHSVAFSPDGKTLLSGGDDRVVTIWDARKGKHIAALEGHEDGVTSVSFSTDGARAVSASRDNTVRVWDLETREPVQVFQGHEFTVMSACFDFEDEYVLSASWDHTIRLWEMATGGCVYKFESFNGCFSDAVLCPGTSTIIGACSDNSVHIIQLAAG